MSRFTRALNQRSRPPKVNRVNEGPGGVFTHPVAGGGRALPAPTGRTPGPTITDAVDRGPGCSAIKQNRQQCRNPAGADGLCRWHRMNASKASKAHVVDLHLRHVRQIGPLVQVMCDAVGPTGPCGYVGEAREFTHLDLGSAYGGVHRLCRDQEACRSRTGRAPRNDDEDDE
jgi:hypothetical protein